MRAILEANLCDQLNYSVHISLVVLKKNYFMTIVYHIDGNELIIFVHMTIHGN